MLDEYALERSELLDSKLSMIRMEGAYIKMVYSNVLMSTTEDLYHRVTVDLGGVREITRDYKPASRVELEGEGSSVINFKRSGDTATMLLNWRHYSEKRSDLALYGFAFGTFHLQGELQDGFADQSCAARL